MLYWLKPITISLVIFLLTLLAFLRFQGWQYIAAYTGGGFARSLPDARHDAKNQSCNTEPLQVLSYNVMYGSAFLEKMAARFRNGETGKGELPWSVRLPEIRSRIASFTPDLLGLQEMGADSDIAAIVPLDQYTLVSYHLGNFQYGDSAILFKTNRFEPLDAGQLWLGNTPELPMSLGFRPLSVIRYVNWVLLREKANGFSFLFANTHFDNASVNKEPSATMFRERIAALSWGLPIIVTGDFNTTARDERYRRFTGADLQPPLLENAYTLANSPPVNPVLHPDQRIDHIFAGGPCKVVAEQWFIDTRPLKNGLSMSDHDPVFARLKFVDRAAVK